MEHVQFGRTGLKVSRLCLGTMTFGFQSDRDTSFEVMDVAHEAGITFFDTADVYPLGAPFADLGRTEEIVGEWMRGKRDRFIVASKCFFPTGPRPWDVGNSRQNIMRAVEASLRRLRTDHLDLYQIHSWDPVTPIDETLQAMDDLVRSGKVRYIGCSNTMAYQLARSIGRSEVLGVSRFESVQPRYNLLFRENERELFPLCAEENDRRDPVQPACRRVAHRQAPQRSNRRRVPGSRWATPPSDTRTGTGTTRCSARSRSSSRWPRMPVCR